MTLLLMCVTHLVQPTGLHEPVRSSHRTIFVHVRQPVCVAVTLSFFRISFVDIVLDLAGVVCHRGICHDIYDVIGVRLAESQLPHVDV